MTIQPRRIETAETRNGSGTASPASPVPSERRPARTAPCAVSLTATREMLTFSAREEPAELPLLPLEERLPPDGGEALERLRERGEERVEKDERDGEEEGEARPDGEVRHASSSGTPSGPGPKAFVTSRRWRRNIVPSSVS